VADITMGCVKRKDPQVYPNLQIESIAAVASTSIKRITILQLKTCKQHFAITMPLNCFQPKLPLYKEMSLPLYARAATRALYPV
jgi:predicted 2-oxoglutarate/Fe(II)-dependent dioxygenase YbiX